ncbi:chitin-binding domain-containing protein [Acinetobacter pittii]|uniref:chitin-binding domain-containing protein n=1 Tax=Acinetobacter pittii TaxID=48296 RepID=UPI00168D10B6
MNEDGSFSYDFESENGIKSAASGSVKVISPEEIAQVVQGSYSFTAPDGSVITRTYVADENGFHAEGADIPTPPPIPEAIARSLELLPKLEEQEQKQQQRKY